MKVFRSLLGFAALLVVVAFLLLPTTGCRPSATNDKSDVLSLQELLPRAYAGDGQSFYELQQFYPAFVTQELCDSVFEKNEFAYRRCSSKYVDTTAKLEAWLSNRYFLDSWGPGGDIDIILKNLPQEERTTALYASLIAKGIDTIRIVPNKMKTEELFLEIIELEKNRFDTADVPMSVWSPKLATAAFNADGENLLRIPKRFVTKKMVADYLKERPAAVRYVPTHLLTKEQVRNALEDNLVDLEGIPKGFLTVELIDEALVKNPRLLCQLPFEMQTLARVRIATANSNDARHCIPAKFLVTNCQP